MIAIVESKLNRVFEALGSPIRATTEDGDLFVRDIIVTAGPDGMYDVFEAGSPDAPIHTVPADDPSTVAGVVAMHIARKIISAAVEA
ncbi:hypothetical protein [Rhizobium sp. BK176]|uniref:hypothetical protein n=1 Tax=Rhizobium sp. BK176 TaxID=2587071 RepID=UPI0021698099|nr:hypothetical protein [Rhizobium sp. BK176]MCS4089680.1 hypothetical protein [Rhizobium sp. BK176]